MAQNIFNPSAGTYAHTFIWSALKHFAPSITESIEWIEDWGSPCHPDDFGTLEDWTREGMPTSEFYLYWYHMDNIQSWLGMDEYDAAIFASQFASIRSFVGVDVELLGALWDMARYGGDNWVDGGVTVDQVHRVKAHLSRGGDHPPLWLDTAAQWLVTADKPGELTHKQASALGAEALRTLEMLAR